MIHEMEAELKVNAKKLKKKLKKAEGGHMGASSPKIKGTKLGERNRKKELEAQQNSQMIIEDLKA